MTRHRGGPREAAPDAAARAARARPRGVPHPLRPAGRPGDDELVFGEWSGNDWDNWRERIFQPAAIAMGATGDTIPSDLRGSFASPLIFEGLNVLEVAPEPGHKPSTCLDIHGRLFEEFDPARRRPAVDLIREARGAVRDGAVPSGYPAAAQEDDESDGATAEEAD